MGSHGDCEHKSESPGTAVELPQEIVEKLAGGIEKAAVNAIRAKLWRRQPRGFRRLAVIDADGTVAAAWGEKKHGIGLSHTGI